MAANEKPSAWQEWKAKHSRWHRLLVLELACVLGLLIGLIWLGGADIWLFWSENRDGLRDLGLTLVAVIGLPLLFWRERTGHRTANIAAERHEKQTEADRERRITDSFTKAVELLGSDKLEARLGAIYALERIARENKNDHGPIMETLTAYLLTRLSEVPPSDESWSFSNLVDRALEKIRYRKDLSVDTQAALTVLMRRKLDHDVDGQVINLTRVNLSEVNLRGVKLIGVNLRRANLFRVDLSEANLFRVDFSQANLFRANLVGANLSGTILGAAILVRASLYGANLSATILRQADLREASLWHADLSGSDLWCADLRKADLQYANLNKAKLIHADLTGANLARANLTEAQLENAKFCNTIMPDGTVNNRDCPPDPDPPNPSETPPTLD